MKSCRLRLGFTEKREELALLPSRNSSCRETLETVSQVEFYGTASHACDALVEEVGGKNVTAHAGYAVFPAAQVRVVEGIESFHSE